MTLTNIKNPTATGSTGTYAIKTTEGGGTEIDGDSAVGADTITFAAANKLGVTTQPSSSTVAGVSFAQQPVVKIQDEFGNTVTDSTVTVAAALQTGGGTLSGTKSVAAVNGVVTYSGLSINLTGTDKVLRFTATSLTLADTTPAISITFAAASKLAVTTQPSSSTAPGTAFAQQPVVTVQDQFANTVTDNTLSVTAALQTGDGTLGGTAAIAAVSGVVTYSGLSIDSAGTNKVLRFTVAGDTLTRADTSPDFSINLGALTSTDVEPESLATGTVGDVDVSLTLATALADTGKVVITFPAGFVVSSGSTTAIGGDGTSFDGTESLTIDAANRKVTITRSGGSTLGASTAITLELTNIKNPTAAGAAGTYTIETTDSAGASRDENTSVAADTFVDGVLTAANVEPESLKSENVGDVDISFTLANALPKDGKVVVIFPSGFVLSSGGTTAIGGDGTSFDGTETVTIDSGNRRVTVTRQNDGTAVASGAVTLELTNIKIPASIGATGTYTILTTNPGDSTIDQLTTVAGDTITEADGADLAVTITYSPDSVTEGEILTYSLSISNSGPQAATDLILTNTLPDGANLVSSTPSIGACSGTSTITCVMGTLDNGATATVSIVVAVTGLGTISNTATVTSNVSDPSLGNNTATESTEVDAILVGTDQTDAVEPSPTADVVELQITQTTSPDTALVGETFTYLITITNSGSVQATEVAFTDVLPSNAKLVSISNDLGTCAGTTTISCSIADLGAGSSAVISITVELEAAGTAVNTATVAANESETDTSDNSTTLSTPVIRRITGVITYEPGRVVKAGETLTITVTLSDSLEFDANISIDTSHHPRREMLFARVYGML
jgi:uncharacterized repeat protein (TIGR01451 family)